MIIDSSQLRIFSARTGEKVASVNLIDIEEKVELGQICQFSVEQGFSRLWKFWHEQKSLSIRNNDDQEILVQVAAFPAERGAPGYLRFDSILPPQTVEEQTSSKKLIKKKRREKPPTFGERLRKLVMR